MTSKHSTPNIQVPRPSKRLPVVFVAGSGHSGSTLLALLLDAHPEIACVGEASVKPRIRRRGDSAQAVCSCGTRIGECPFWTEVFSLVQAQGLAFGASEWTNDYRFEHPFMQRLLNRACGSRSGRALIRGSASWLPGYRQRVSAIDAVNMAFMQAALTVSKARVFADTTKTMSRLLHLLRLPGLDIRVVGLVRDARGYAASAKRRGISPLDAAGTWRKDQEMIAALVRERPTLPFHQLRYEDLCASPDTVLRELWSFCGVQDVPIPQPLSATAHHVLGNSMRMAGDIRIRVDQTWRQRLDDAEAAAVLGVAGELNRALGYED